MVPYECISCIKDGKTGICRDIKDKISREKIGELTEKVNEVIERVNNGGTGGGVSTGLATQVNNHEERITSVETTVSVLNTQVTDIDGRVQINNMAVNDHEIRLQDIENGGTAFGKVNKNLLLNQTLKINQRGKTQYPATSSGYCVDRWYKPSNVIVSVTAGDGRVMVENTSTTEKLGIYQYIENTSDILNKPLALHISYGEGGSMTHFSTLPASTTDLTQNSIIQAIETTFGEVRIEWKKEHFFLNILLNPSTTMLFNYVKLEVGELCTGLEEKSIEDETKECMRFYQSIDCGAIFVPGYIERTATMTYHYAVIHLEKSMRNYPSFKSNNMLPQTRIIKAGQPAETITWNSISSPILSKDNRVITPSFNVAEDNTALLGDNSTIYEWCGIRIQNCGADAEITK